MNEYNSFSTRWSAYQPTKTTWLWSVLGAVAATMIIGFTAGDWTTGGTAREMASEASSDARAELVAAICVQNFAAAPDGPAQFAALKETSGWQRDDFIEDGGWVKVPGIEDDVPGAAQLCANDLAAMEALPVATSQAEVVGG